MGRDMTTTIGDAIRHAANEWQLARDEHRLNPKAKIGFYQLPSATGFTIVLVDRIDGARRVAIQLGGATSPVYHVEPLSMTAEAGNLGNGSRLMDWIKAQFSPIALEKHRFWGGEGEPQLTDPLYLPGEAPAGPQDQTTQTS